MKTPNTRLQAARGSTNAHFGFGIWDFFGVWFLLFGVWSADLSANLPMMKL